MGTLTPRFDLPLIAVNQAQKDVTHNEAVTALDVLSHLVIQSRILNSPPLSPQVGEAWIVDVGAINEWVNQDGNIAFWTGGGWRFAPAQDGVHAWVLDEMNVVRYMQGVWVVVLAAPQPAISDPNGGVINDVEARAAISSILTTLRTHGLIATI
ncbi:MAG: DUF2793 domain-containing protein [Sphingomonadales bacterium]|jgi:hypothetical protein